jgi:hypothetical protein
MGGAARFHHHGAGRLLGQEGAHGRSWQARPPAYVSGTVRDCELENSLCNVSGDGGMVLHDGLLLFAEQRDFGTSMSIKS